MNNLDINRSMIKISNIKTNNLDKAQKAVKTNFQGQNVDFKSLLEKQLLQSDSSKIVFSKHAMQRVQERNIDVSQSQLAKLGNAIQIAKNKGVKDALVLNGDNAFIVNTISNTVVTALNGNEMKNNVFTNIDGTVII
ncbi:MAG: TIGR02530 family flagellar biosynthesis protein [Oscillospiraceae bacterium]